MAIVKSKVLPSGIEGEYWKITQESYDRLSGKATWVISLFLNRDASLAGAKPLPCHKTFKVSVTRDEMQGNRTELGYQKIKLEAAKMVPVFGTTDGSMTKLDSDIDGGEDV